MKIAKNFNIKVANTFDAYNPYKVDFTKEEEKVSKMDNISLLYSLKDAIEATKGVNEGKYYDQASVYRKVLENRGISYAMQNKILENTPSLHWSPENEDQEWDRMTYEADTADPSLSPDPYKKDYPF